MSDVKSEPSGQVDLGAGNAAIDSLHRDQQQTNLNVLGPFQAVIEQSLKQACDFGDGCPDHLAGAMRYALLAPGKRLRPILVLMAADACLSGADDSSILGDAETLSRVMPAAVAVEMIHAYSLIHDDLPAMDDDDLRRGRPTVHIQFDEATAILAGDALQAEAFRHLTTAGADPAKLLVALQVLTNAAGAGQLVGGQADDLLAESVPPPDQRKSRDDNDPAGEVDSATLSGTRSIRVDLPGRSNGGSVERLESIHRRKTGALLSASLELGAILSGASPDQRSALSAYGRHLGLAFQVVDDYLDYTADASVMGKRTGKDAARGKLTYPGLMGAQASWDKAVQLVTSAKEEAAFFGPRSQRLAWMANYVLERTH